ncbi:Trypsin-3 [Collichthys lucidus]|uniref:trypsin n=1 Tax=Collichthys lucidus TaxID=240159 RepID=A0A4U5USK6_COLLU|nr:Trypsin-3 [Collichthys lucidus]
MAQGRIVGGYAPVPHSIKYIVSIQTTDRRHICGGSLINKFWVITAAHCDIGVKHMMIVAGDYSLAIYEGTEQEIMPQLLVPHPGYNKTTKNNDIMLIKLRAPVYLNSYVSIALLPRHGASIAEGRMCRVSGWGYTSASGGQIPSTLRTVKLPIVSTEKCNSSESFNGIITENMLCAGFSTGGKDACKLAAMSDGDPVQERTVIEQNRVISAPVPSGRQIALPAGDGRQITSHPYAECTNRCHPSSRCELVITRRGEGGGGDQ